MITLCCECNRGGNGNDVDKCACGWRIVENNGLGCYLGQPIVGEIKPKQKISRSKARYQRYLRSDGWNSFRDFLLWETSRKKEMA